MIEDIGKNLATRIRQLRLSKNLTQEQLADQAEIDASVLSRIERGQRTNMRLETLNKIVAALDVDYSTLFAFTNSDKVTERISAKLTLIEDDKALDTIENLIDLLVADKE